MNLENIFKSQKDFFYADTTIPVNFRILHLSKLKKALLENKDELLKALYKDLGKSEEEFLLCEFSPCIMLIDYFIKNIKRLCKPKKIKSKTSKPIALIYKKPFGVVLIKCTWRFPLLLSILPLIGVISSGNTCIIKLHPFSKNTNEVISKIISLSFEKCYAFSIDKDYSLDQLKFDYIFKSSEETLNKYLPSQYKETLTKTNPCIVHKDSNVKLSSKKICQSKFLNSGQNYLSPDCVYVHKDIKEEFISLLIENIKNMHLSTTSKIINEDQFNNLTEIIHNAKDKIIYGGKIDKDNLKISPTLIELDNFHTLEEKILSPILKIKSYESVDEVIYYIKYNMYPLCICLFSTNRNLINKYLDIPFEFGYINDAFTLDKFKTNKFRNYHATYYFNTFTHEKVISLKDFKVKKAY